jgi:AraC-like DNA-binding protein
VKTLAKRCDVSTRTLERFIKLKFAASPHDWMIDLRMRRAVELLPETASIKEASDQLGYKNQNHFSREFKKHYGHAPSLPQSSKRMHCFPLSWSFAYFAWFAV